MEIRFPLILDGATGTELQKYGYAGDVSAEQWTLAHPDIMREIQRGYVAAGSQVLYTPTFGANRQKLEERGIFNRTADFNRRLAALSREAADGKAWIAGDLAPTGLFLAPLGEASFEDLVDIYTEQAAGLEAAGVDLFVIETMMTLSDARAAVLAVRSVSDKPIFVSFTCDESGRSLSGTDVTAALTVLQGMGISAFGLNCSTGPEQMLVQLRRLREYARVPLIAKPNAGMPITVGGKTVYDCTPEDFTAYVPAMLEAGVAVFGGCCGTTPAHIAALRAELDALPQQTEAAPAAKLSTGTAPAVEKDDTFLRKLNAGEKVIAIELDSPRVADLSGYLDGARRLQAAGADLLTIADCPIAQARMDSSLVACRVHRELGMCALPHMTCRDRNLNATKALLLGLYAEGVREVLAITGDPIPTAERDEVKNVYQFNSRKLAQYIVSLAGEGREMPSAMTVFGALNLNARNFDVELRRAVEKLENGMSGFLTQPVLSAQAGENLRKARQTLGERAKILAGIMPVVSQRNAIFMENEINGIHVEEDIIQRFAGLDREQGEALGLEVSMQMAREALPYADGFYLMTPFNRVALMERLIARLKTELLDAEG